MNTSEIARNILGALQPLMGPAASGQLLVHATGANTALAAGAKATPIVAGTLLEQATVFVRPNPATSDGSWTVTAAGTLVTVEAVQGGTAGNKDAGTVYRWDPPLGGIEATSAASAPGLTGGSYNTVLGTLRQARLYRELAVAGAQTFFRAQLAEFPGVALAWESTTPLDGALASAPGPRTARVGRGRFLSRDTWILWIVTSRLDSNAARSQEADELRDLIIDMLLDTRSVRSVLPISQSPGVTLLDARVFAVFPTSYVDVVRFGTVRTRQHIDSATYSNWLATRVQMLARDDVHADDKVMVDVTVPMPQRPDVIMEGHVVAGWDAASITESPVSLWRDESGNGFDLTASGTARPTRVPDGGPNGLPCVRFDAVANSMANATLNRPAPLTARTYVWAIIRQISFGGARRFWAFGTNLSHLALFNGSSGLLQANSIFANVHGGLGGTGASPFKRLEVLFSGSTSDFIRAGAAPKSTGATAGNDDPAAGFTLGSAPGGTNCANFDLCELWLFDVEPDAQQAAALDAYAAHKYGSVVVA